MRLVVQRVSSAQCTVDGEVTGRIDQGYMVLVGLTHSDDRTTAEKMAEKLYKLRVFDDGQGKMNLSVSDIGGSVLSISQFTLYADCRKGNRPSFTDAAAPDKADELYRHFNSHLEEQGVTVEKGIFGADMKVSLLNDGPVTIILDSEVLW